MNEEMKKLETPAVVVDLDIVARNIRTMLQNAEKCGLKHRPHIKTHRCSELAHMQIDAGCSGITAAKLGEAEVMAKAGIEDIFVAYPIIGADKIARLLSLAKKIHIITAVNSLQGAQAISEAFEKAGLVHEVLIEVDGGLCRGGVQPGEPTLRFAQQIADLPGITIKGLMYYGGLVYDSHNIQEIEQYAKKENDELYETAQLLRNAGIEVDICSAGSSFTGKTPEYLKDITEIRSGHYIFNDCGQIDVGLVTPKDCALMVIATVVAKADDHIVIADVGTKNLTSDSCHHRKGYGYVLEHPEVEIYNLNEEHAFLRTARNNPLQIGDKIAIIPNHACVVSNLVDEVYAFSGEKFSHMLKIDARGKSV